MLEPFESLRDTLLRAGVAPAHVRRYLRELDDHACDLVGEELKAGRSLAEARAAARARLGADEILVEAVLAEPSLRSWTARAPWATLVVGPMVLLVLAWLVPLVILARLIGPQPSANTMFLAPVGGAMLDLAQFAGPLVIGCGIALLAARQRSSLMWPLLGCLVMAFFGGGLHWVAHWPATEPQGGRVGWSLSIGFRWRQSLAMGSLDLAVAAALYGMVRGRTIAAA